MVTIISVAIIWVGTAISVVTSLNGISRIVLTIVVPDLIQRLGTLLLFLVRSRLFCGQCCVGNDPYRRLRLKIPRCIFDDINRDDWDGDHLLIHTVICLMFCQDRYLDKFCLLTRIHIIDMKRCDCNGCQSSRDHQKNNL
jgi:hypothetical protein